jgi:hypothetical protein
MQKCSAAVEHDMHLSVMANSWKTLMKQVFYVYNVKIVLLHDGT